MDPTTNPAMNAATDPAMEPIHNLESETADRPADFNNSGIGQLKVPGYGLPLNYWTAVDETLQRHVHKPPCFRRGLDDFTAQRLTVKEIVMLRLMNSMTDKPRWEEDVLDDEIVSKWRAEVNSGDNILMTDAAFDWCIREVRDKVNAYKRLRYVKVLDNATVCVKSDILIEEKTRLKLKEAVQPLLDSVDKDPPLLNSTDKGWHPHANDQIINLVNPSMYPLVYGQSQVLASGRVGLDDCVSYVGRGQTIPIPELHNYDPEALCWTSALESRTDFWSTNFQWLPCEVQFVGTSGTEVKITSYVNDLHPIKHKDLYRIIETVISASIAPWNDTLIEGANMRTPPRIHTLGAEAGEGVAMPDWVDRLWQGQAVDEQFAEYIVSAREYLDIPSHPSWMLSAEAEAKLRQDLEDIIRLGSLSKLEDLMIKKHQLTGEVFHPDPGVSYTYDDWKAGKDLKPVVLRGESTWYEDPVNADPINANYEVSLEQTFRQQGLQVIVKLASIELTPEKPDYPGGNWHLPGMLNEHIVATSVYYYDVDNTTEASIRFRRDARFGGAGCDYEEDECECLCAIFGAESYNDGRPVQEIGKIATPQSRLLAFSNIGEHRVESFGLIDRTRPGHRRYLLLWLVDPHFRITSTANVPLQQFDWWADEYRKASGGKLPTEVDDMITSIFAADNGLIRRAEAEDIRLKLKTEWSMEKYGKYLEGTFGPYHLREY